MKNKYLLFLLLGFVDAKYFGQVNLVMNPSFESYTACPTLSGDVNKAIGWDTCRGSADFFHECAPTSLAQVPENYFGKQYPKHGDAYFGFYTYADIQFYREVIIGTLTQSLIPFQKYFISFQVSRADSNYIVGYSSNKLGVKFSKVKQSNVSINNTSHFYSNTIITDTVNWTKISGSFIADSAYTYLMIGNFFDDANTNIINHGNGLISYYYIDEVCVTTDSLYAENYVTTGFIKHNDATGFKILPNPANNIFVVTGIGKGGVIKVYNAVGSLIYEEGSINEKKIEINCELWSAGIYFVRTERFNCKLLINH